MSNVYQEKYPEFKKFFEEIKELISNIATSPKEIILDEEDVQKLLKISRRTLAQLRAERKITYYQPSDKPANKKSMVNEENGNLRSRNGGGSKIYYFYSDVLAYVKRNTIPAISDNIK